jgi:ERF superfamily
MATEMEIEEAPVPKPAGFVLLAPGTIASDFSLARLNAALGAAQNEFTPAFKAEENKFVGYKYVPLEAIIAAVRPSLTKYHLTLSQFPVTNLEDKTISVYTRLVHWDSGEWIQNELILPAELALGKDGAPKFNQQTIGGSQTYAQKYAYKAILGVPDSEEMIDSSDEKGDLPSRRRTAPTPAPQGAAQGHGQASQDDTELQEWSDAASECLDIDSATRLLNLAIERNSIAGILIAKRVVMAHCGTLEAFNNHVIPMMKDGEWQFIVAAAGEAKRRGYRPDRVTGLYVGKRQS